MINTIIFVMSHLFVPCAAGIRFDTYKSQEREPTAGSVHGHGAGRCDSGPGGERRGLYQPGRHSQEEPDEVGQPGIP